MNSSVGIKFYMNASEFRLSLVLLEPSTRTQIEFDEVDNL